MPSKGSCKCKVCVSRIAAGQKPKHKSLALKKPHESAFLERLPKAKVYVITYAQNATPVFQPFWKSLLTFCKQRNAELVVIPGRYTNPTSVWSKNMEHDEWWDECLDGYLFQGRRQIGKGLTVYGDISIQPTASSPLSGFHAFANESAVFGHPKIHLETVATGKRNYPRIFTTTGAVTKPNYTGSKAGKKGAAGHTFGGTLVEEKDGLFHIRQIISEPDGSFIDLNYRYTASGAVQRAPRAKAVICGDIHVAHPEKAVLKATFGASGIVETLRPEIMVYHDLLDFDTRNHHTINDFYDRYDRVGTPKDSVEEEIKDACSFIDRETPKDALPVIVRSNHDEAFERWLKTANPFQDPVNAPFFFKTWYKLCERRQKNGKWENAFKLHYQELGENRAKFLERDELFRIGDAYCNYHGDVGSNGSRGSALAFSKLGGKFVIGHSHRPKIVDGCIQVGVSGALDQGYNGLPSNWLHAHAAIYANNRATLIFIIDGEWRGS